MMEQKVINVLTVFPALNAELLGLLQSLDNAAWEQETCLKGRRVKDLVSHLIDTSLRRLAMDRDGYFTAPPEIHSHQDLVDFIQSQNNAWMQATQRLSPQILLSLLQSSGDELVDFLATLDPQGKALFPVNWAGESESENWFDIAREYTEKWHHQMQIREALGIEGRLYEKAFFQPIIDCFVRAIPVAYAAIPESAFTLNILISGDCGGHYVLQKSEQGIVFTLSAPDQTEGSLAELTASPETAVNTIRIDQKEFWRLVTNSKPKAHIDYEAEGDERITRQFLSVVAVMS
ncbi:maleylpyruvate isomerase N-terminal domain-containing protein [Photobacterium aphoticum]|uniref:maleylpyruvate isomerase N-terminal domain-containing protein n=1 Tax=Photobacterium aphoticum TaxID=754436 RepID=UPI00069FD88E|nr:maleylpyruvate isomerase N-terminal domain-containing protein [Photobacterium aphoticum]PSU57883.1 hypothetical protein C9I90_08405 [Photobacterium aphoticum]GHA60370.1 hypothetical protein GCM10007086_37720 [Photobacterium aphoticum]